MRPHDRPQLNIRNDRTRAPRPRDAPRGREWGVAAVCAEGGEMGREDESMSDLLEVVPLLISGALAFFGGYVLGKLQEKDRRP